MQHKSAFTDAVEEFMWLVPTGKVVTYGQVAASIGQPKASRQVGGTAHFGNPDVPWHRLVNRFGGLASGYPGGRQAQKQHLEQEGVVFKKHDSEWLVDMATHLWDPHEY